MLTMFCKCYYRYKQVKFVIPYYGPQSLFLERRSSCCFIHKISAKQIKHSLCSYSELIMHFKYIIYIVLVLNRSWTDAEDTEVYRMSDRVFTCSKWLSSVIDNFCNKVFKIVKRETSLLIDKLTPKDLRKSRNKQNLLRVRRQVASECCERPCTVGNIIMYCPDDAKLLIEDPDIFD